jgi:hypothetical protein
MTKRDVLSVALKVLGVWSIVHSTSLLLLMGISLDMLLRNPKPDPSYRVQFIWGGVGFVLALFAAYVLLHYGDGIARRLVPVDSGLAALGATEWEKPLFVLSLRIIGALCVVRGISNWVRPVALLVVQARYAEARDVYDWADVIAATLYVLLGAYLISGGRHLVEFAFRTERISQERGAE